jgi:hypothetical protein
MREKIALWANDNRASPTHPHLKAGKPVTIAGQEYWASCFVNLPPVCPEGMQTRVDGFVKALAEINDKYPILSVILTPVETQVQAAPAARAMPAGQRTPADVQDLEPF